jgi:hypothetical protein
MSGVWMTGGTPALRENIVGSAGVPPASAQETLP